MPGTSPGMTDMMARSSGGFPVGTSVNGGLRFAKPPYELFPFLSRARALGNPLIRNDRQPAGALISEIG